MNTETGKLFELTKEESSIEDILNGTFVQVKNKNMTKKQKNNMQVSLKDHRSLLGIELTEIKRQRFLLTLSEKDIKKKVKTVKVTYLNTEWRIFSVNEWVSYRTELIELQKQNGCSIHVETKLKYKI